MQELLEIGQLSVGFGEAMAVRGIDLVIRRGEAVGMIGESGSGKSVTWLGALGLLPATATITGRVLLDGRELLGASVENLEKIRGRRAAMIFQDATSALNPVHTIGRQVAEVLRLHRNMEGAAAQAEAQRLFDLVGLPDARRRLKSYPHELSGGQNQRVMIAMALAGRPDLLIADEPTTALDVTIQAQILDLLREIQRETGMALVLISHDLGVIAEVCSRAYVMYAGEIVEAARVEDLFETPQHPYTRGLLEALPRLDGPLRRLKAIPGSVPAASLRDRGCMFAPRCARRIEACSLVTPQLAGGSRGRLVACLNAYRPELAETVA